MKKCFTRQQTATGNTWAIDPEYYNDVMFDKDVDKKSRKKRRNSAPSGTRAARGTGKPRRRSTKSRARPRRSSEGDGEGSPTKGVAPTVTGLVSTPSLDDLRKQQSEQRLQYGQSLVGIDDTFAEFSRLFNNAKVLEEVWLPPMDTSRLPQVPGCRLEMSPLPQPPSSFASLAQPQHTLDFPPLSEAAAIDFSQSAATRADPWNGLNLDWFCDNGPSFASA